MDSRKKCWGLYWAMERSRCGLTEPEGCFLSLTSDISTVPHQECAKALKSSINFCSSSKTCQCSIHSTLRIPSYFSSFILLLSLFQTCSRLRWRRSHEVPQFEVHCMKWKVRGRFWFYECCLHFAICQNVPNCQLKMEMKIRWKMRLFY